MDQFLIIGASGFVGGHLFRFLSGQPGTDVVGTRRQSPGTELTRFDLANDSIRDCLDPEWRAAGGTKFAIVCSAVVPMDRCATEPDYARSVMLDGTRRCIDELVGMHFTPVFLSTSYVFDGHTGGYREHDPPAPLGRYGQLKRDIELYLEATCPDSLIVRLDKTLGTIPSEDHLFSDWYRLVSQGKPIVCIADQQFGPTLVDDVASIVHRACLEGLVGYYHIANPEPVLRAELAARFLQACRFKTDVRSVPLSELRLPEPRPLRSWLNSDKIQTKLGVSFTSTDEMLRRFAAAV